MALNITAPCNPFSNCSTKQECLERLRNITDDIETHFVGMVDNRHNRELLQSELKYWQDYCEHHIHANGLDIEPLHGVDIKIFVTGELKID